MSAAQIRYQKSRSILWVMLGDGILLRNFSTNVAFELNSEKRKIWELLDGAHKLDQLLAKLGEEKISHGEALDLIALLESEGFVIRL